MISYVTNVSSFHQNLQKLSKFCIILLTNKLTNTTENITSLTEKMGNNNNNNNNNWDDIYSAVIMTTGSLREFTQFI